MPNFKEDRRVKRVDVLKLPNVGGCDYAYAHFINRYIANTAPKDAASSLIVFIKDTPRKTDYMHFPLHERFREVDEMLQMASDGRYVCGAKPHCAISPVHDTQHLYSYSRSTIHTRITNKKQNESATGDMSTFNLHRYTNLKDFHERALNWKFPNEHFTEVCYGGTFALSASQLLSSLSKDLATKNAIKALEKSLSRNITSSIEEHFAERTWAGMLANPIDIDEAHALQTLQSKKLGGIVKISTSVMGPLLANFRICKKHVLPQRWPPWTSAKCHGLKECVPAVEHWFSKMEAHILKDQDGKN